jgi:hypothetical protein
MIALVNATGAYTATASVTGALSIQSNPPGTPISASTFFDWNTAVKVYVPDVTLTVNALIGSKVNNTSDGSTGTITANTAHTITVGALTGGGTNKFLKGDFIDIVSATTNYVFKEALWKPRKVGSMETAPFPSFVGKKISELFYAKSRLGFVSENRVVTSRTSDYLNLFRESATQLLPSDPIDVISATQAKANFHSAVHWNEVLMLWSSQGQFVFDGTPQLTPETVSIVEKSEYINSTRLRPVPAGNKIYFARGKGKSTQVLEYELVETGDRKADAQDITKHIPTYIAGTPIQMVVDPSLGILALLTDADQSKLYVYSYHYENETLIQSAWDRWEFAAGTRIVSIDVQDGKLGLVVSRPGGVYLETIDLDPAADNSSILAVRSLDRRIKGDAAGLVSTFLAGVVSWTLPCSIAVDGSEGTLVVARISTGQIVPSTRSGPTNVTVTGLGDIRSDCYIGVLYTWRVKLSTIMKRAVGRDGREAVVTTGRLILRYLTAKFHDTTDLVGTVTLSGRSAGLEDVQECSTHSS